MRCRQASEMMSERLDGRLGNAEITTLDDHLVACSVCQTEWQKLQRPRTPHRRRRTVSLPSLRH